LYRFIVPLDIQLLLFGTVYLPTYMVLTLYMILNIGSLAYI